MRCPKSPLVRKSISWGGGAQALTEVGAVGGRLSGCYGIGENKAQEDGGSERQEEVRTDTTPD